VQLIDNARDEEKKEVAYGLKTKLTSTMEDARASIQSNLTLIRNSSEGDGLSVKLGVVRDRILEMKGHKKEDTDNIRRAFSDISTHCTDLQGMLSSRLEETLENLNPDKS
jgi:hypothetical protein